MLCEKCKKNQATTYIKTIINGKYSEKHLCSECYKEENDFAGGFSVGDMFSSMFGDSHYSGLQNGVTHCPLCGSSINDISNTGKAGCPECYKTFRKQLLPFIKRVHGSVSHTGKSLNKLPVSENTEKSELQKLKEQLQVLISEEKFEEAAKVRDRIKELEKE